MNTVANSLVAAAVLAGAGVVYQLQSDRSDAASSIEVPPILLDSKPKMIEVPVRLEKLVKTERHEIGSVPVIVVESQSDKTPDIDAETQGNPENRSTLKLTFSQENHDTHWSTETELSLAETIQADIGKGSQLRGVVCRETVCRLQLEHRNQDSELEFLATFARTGQFTNDGNRGSYVSARDQDGAIVADFYYGKSSG